MYVQLVCVCGGVCSGIRVCGVHAEMACGVVMGVCIVCGGVSVTVCHCVYTTGLHTENGARGINCDFSNCRGGRGGGGGAVVKP